MPSYLTQFSPYPANTHFPKLRTDSSINQERSQSGDAQTWVTSTTNQERSQSGGTQTWVTSTTNARCLSDVDTDVTPSLKLLQYVIIPLWLLYFDFDICLFVFKTRSRNVTQVVLELIASILLPQLLGVLAL